MTRQVHKLISVTPIKDKDIKGGQALSMGVRANVLQNSLKKDLKLMSEQMLATVNIPTLRQGNQGEAVKILQLLLDNFHGYSIAVDGKFGQGTLNAVLDFQAAHQLSRTGVVDNATWEVLANQD